MDPSEKSPTVTERLAEARAAKALRDEKAQAADDARELLELDLEAKYDAELGPKGQRFDIVVFRALDQVVALKAPSPVDAKIFSKTYRGARESTIEEATDYVRKHVLHPADAVVFGRWLGDHPSAVWECLLLLKALEGARLGAKEGKPGT